MRTKKEKKNKMPHTEVEVTCARCDTSFCNMCHTRCPKCSSVHIKDNWLPKASKKQEQPWWLKPTNKYRCLKNSCNGVNCTCVKF